jgi:uroporphyrinogen decarboxylase
MLAISFISYLWIAVLFDTTKSFSCTTCKTFKFSPLFAEASSTYPIQNDLMIRAARGEKVERTPVWIFRQAGRHLPEYTEYKKTTGKNFLQLLDDPKDVTECTMQPIRRYNLDAAILFSDILVILQALGMDVLMPGGVGILVPSPLLNPSEVASRVPVNVNVEDKLSHVIAAVRLIKEELKGSVPLIGFSAAPWTLMYYMVGGSSKKNKEIGSMWLKDHPLESKALLDILTTIVIEYTSAQIKAGADMMQIFEAMGEFINEEDFYKWALPCMTRISSELRIRHPNTPLLVFPKGATYALSALQQAGYDVVTLDTQCERLGTRAILEKAAFVSSPLGRVSTVQGNFDVALLKTGASTVEEIRLATKEMLLELGTQKLIANLGEGLTGTEDPLLVGAFIDSVHDLSEKMISESKI